MTDGKRRWDVELESAELEALSELEGREPETLRAVADYLEELAAWKEHRAQSGDDGYPEGVPERASVSVEEIAGTEIRYYQWREDDEIRSVTERLRSGGQSLE